MLENIENCKELEKVYSIKRGKTFDNNNNSSKIHPLDT
jgi:hypothetical protein